MISNEIWWAQITVSEIGKATPHAIPVYFEIAVRATHYSALTMVGMSVESMNSASRISAALSVLALFMVAPASIIIEVWFMVTGDDCCHD